MTVCSCGLKDGAYQPILNGAYLVIEDGQVCNCPGAGDGSSQGEGDRRRWLAWRGQRARRRPLVAEPVRAPRREQVPIVAVAVPVAAPRLVVMAAPQISAPVRSFAMLSAPPGVRKQA